MAYAQVICTSCSDLQIRRSAMIHVVERMTASRPAGLQCGALELHRFLLTILPIRPPLMIHSCEIHAESR